MRNRLAWFLLIPFGVLTFVLISNPQIFSDGDPLIVGVAIAACLGIIGGIAAIFILPRRSRNNRH